MARKQTRWIAERVFTEDGTNKRVVVGVGVPERLSRYDWKHQTH